MASALRGSWVQLRPLLASDYEFVQSIELRSDRIAEYRHRGRTPSPEAFAQSLWQGVLVQFIVEEYRVSPRRRLGLVTAYQPDFRNQHSQLALLSATSGDIFSGKYIEGVELFIDYLFETFNFRKLSSYVLDCNLAPFERGLRDLVVSEGQLKEHEYYNGEWIDVHILSIFRPKWERRSAIYLRGERSNLDQGIVSPDIVSFVGAVDEALALDLDDYSTCVDADLCDDLGFDSLSMLVLLDMIETDDYILDDAAQAAITTFRDAFHFYAAARGLE